MRWLMTRYSRWLSNGNPRGVLFCALFIIVQPIFNLFMPFPIRLAMSLFLGACVGRLCFLALTRNSDAMFYKALARAQEKLIYEMLKSDRVEVTVMPMPKPSKN